MSQPKTKLLKPGNEYPEYVEFCNTNFITPTSEGEFYKGCYFLALRGLVAGFAEDNVVSYELEEISLILCDVKDHGLILSIFLTKDINEHKIEASPENTNPIDHIN